MIVALALIAGAAAVCPATTVTKSATLQRTLTVDDRERFYRVHVPESHTGLKHYPVVLNFHGYTSAALEQELLSGMNEIAAARDVIVVYPNGVANKDDIGGAWNSGLCCGTAQEENVDDIEFVRQILADLEDFLCIDSSRVYATGFSNGGFQSYRIACEAPELITAVAAVASGIVTLCDSGPGKSMPLMSIAGRADAVVAYDDSIASKNAFVAFNQCTDPPTEVFSERDTVCESHGGCAAMPDGYEGTNEVRSCTVNNGSHFWFRPQYGNGIDSSAAIIDFFLQYGDPEIAQRTYEDPTADATPFRQSAGDAASVVPAALAVVFGVVGAVFGM